MLDNTLTAYLRCLPGGGDRCVNTEQATEAGKEELSSQDKTQGYLYICTDSHHTDILGTSIYVRLAPHSCTVQLQTLKLNSRDEYCKIVRLLLQI